MRTPKTLRDIEDVARTAAHPAQLRQLIALIRDEMGYNLYQRVSAVKAALSNAPSARLLFEHEGLAVDRLVSREDFETWIAPDLARIGQTVDAVLAQAGIAPGQVDRVFLTGGTSFVPAVSALFTSRFGAEKISAGGEFVSVAEGLALIARDRLGG